MKAKVEVKDGRITVKTEKEVIATNFDKRHPPLPESFIQNGWMFGFPKEVNVATYVNENIGECLEVDNTTGAVKIEY